MDSVDNLLTVDLEEWFVVEIFSERFKAQDWDGLTSTVIRNTRRLLDLFRRHGARATFFTLGWIANKYPDLLQEIVNDGHEVACHSYHHRRVDLMDRETFRRDTEMALDAIFKAIGNRPIGYRAPSWSINSRIPWAFEVLADLGFEYDSSIFPIKHDIYGMPQGPRTLFKMTFENGKHLWELPASTWRVLGHNFPVAGGGFFRHSPYWYSRHIMRKLNEKDIPAVVYVHPWEFDSDPPRIEGLSRLESFRAYSSTSILFYKFNRLLQDFTFTTVADYIYSQGKRRIGFH